MMSFSVNFSQFLYIFLKLKVKNLIMSPVISWRCAELFFWNPAGLNPVNYSANTPRAAKTLTSATVLKSQATKWLFLPTSLSGIFLDLISGNRSRMLLKKAELGAGFCYPTKESLQIQAQHQSVLRPLFSLLPQ